MMAYWDGFICDNCDTRFSDWYVIDEGPTNSFCSSECGEEWYSPEKIRQRKVEMRNNLIDSILG